MGGTDFKMLRLVETNMFVLCSEAHTLTCQTRVVDTRGISVQDGGLLGDTRVILARSAALSSQPAAPMAALDTATR